MASNLEDEIGDAECVALNYARADFRPKLAAFFALDRRLGQIVASSSETMLGQMRLAWWRDMLNASAQDRPAGDVVLDAIGQSWGGEALALQPVVDAWEVFLVAEELATDVLAAFGDGRSAPIVAALGSLDARTAEQVQVAGALWALADTAAYVSDETERAKVLDLAKATLDAPTSLARIPRSLAVLKALSLRAIARGGRPLMEGRGAALTALRAGLIGR